MPLNLNDIDDQQSPADRPPGPILREPGGDGGTGSRRGILIAAGGITILLIFFVVWKFDLFHFRGDHRTEESSASMTETPHVSAPQNSTPASGDAATSPPRQNVQTMTQAPPVQPAASSSSLASKKTGTYTIYISRQKSRARADEESSRWNAAGYESRVTPAGEWFKVSIGRYGTWEEAKAAAVALEDGFEAGYLVGKITE